MNWLAERFGVRVPVVSAPMGGASGGRLAAAVSAAGGFGMIGPGAGATPSWIREQDAIARAAGRPYGIGLQAWVLERQPELLDAVLDCRPALAAVSYGDYPPAIARLRDAGIVTCTQVGTTAEAGEAAAAGVDLLVVRGSEGGGHGRGEVATLPLLQAVLDRTDAPVLAAGGITGARGLAAVLAAGADGAWVGTAFLACQEALTGGQVVERLLRAGETDTVYGRVFDIAPRFGWPARYGGRALRNPFFDRWFGREAELAVDDDAHAEYRAGVAAGDLDVVAVYAGQGVGSLDAVRPAAAVIADFTAARERLTGAAADWPAADRPTADRPTADRPTAG
jgi:nitronate monooxygenase